jgi:hypothetical protein
MLNSSASLWLGVTFVVIGAINVCLVLQASARVRDAKASARLIAGHRIGGYLFIALFCAMGYFMVARLGDVAGGALPSTVIHLSPQMCLGCVGCQTRNDPHRSMVAMGTAEAPGFSPVHRGRRSQYDTFGREVWCMTRSTLVRAGGLAAIAGGALRAAAQFAPVVIGSVARPHQGLDGD